jgi:ureidoglycolate dehydrogenase (NAD+)
MIMKDIRVDYNDLKRFVEESLKSIGVCQESAIAVRDGLCETSLYGIDSHGVKLLQHYVNKARSGRISLNPNFRFDLKSSCAGILDANHAFGHHAGLEAIKKAIALAREYGIGAISVKNSSHYGAAGFFAKRAAEQGLIGLSFTHADSLMLSKNGKRPFFGTNPISFCAPVEGEEPFYLDMATTNISWNHVMNSAINGNYLSPGWAVDENANEVTDPKIAKALLPIGDYKGFALGMMVEILCSLLTEMPYGRDITSMYKHSIEKPRYLGHFFLAIDISSFTNEDSFKRRLKEMMDQIRNEPQKGSEPVICPGDPQKKAKSERIKRGIPLFINTWNDYQRLSVELSVKLPKLIEG